jgi:hypothetical protein
MFSGAAFALENPDQAKDQFAQYVAEAEGALKAYSAILLQDSKAKSKALDESAQKRAGGGEGVRSGRGSQDLPQLNVIPITC